MDKAYADDELGKLGIADFEKTVVSISNKIFSPDKAFSEDELTDEEAVMFNAVVNSHIITSGHIVAQKAQPIQAASFTASTGW